MLSELFAGEFAKPDRQHERRRLEEHVQTCPSSRSLCVEHAHRVVTLPILRRVARERDLAVTELQRRLAKTADRMAHTPVTRHRRFKPADSRLIIPTVWALLSSFDHVVRKECPFRAASEP